MNATQKRSPMETFLNLFTEVRPGEGPSALMLCLNVFLIFTAYYIIKPVREALILTGGGAEVKSYAAAGQAMLLLLAIPLYSRLASRFPRRRLINIVTIFFAGCLVLFYILAQTNLPLGIVFYLWVGIFNLMIPAQFWAFANDIYTPESGKRIFVLIAFGASAGAVFGASATGRLIQFLGEYQLLLLSSAILLGSLILTNIVEARERKPIEIKEDTSLLEEPLKKGSLFDAFEMVFKHKYLLLIAFVVLFLNWVNTTGEYILSRTVTEVAAKTIQSGAAGALTEGQFIGKFYADFFAVVNVAGLAIQLFIVSRILKYLGIRVAILILPFIALGGYFIIAFFPILSIVRWAKTAENATDYSLNNTVRHALFLPTTREQKYKAKQAIDTFFQRMGDVLTAGLVYAGTTWFAFQTKQFAIFNLGLVIIWIILGVLIGIENKKLVARMENNPENTKA